MTDSAKPRPTDRLVDAALILAAASLAALIHPTAIGLAALAAATGIIVLRIRGLAALPKAMGPAGWITVIFGVFVAASAAWSVDPVLSVLSSLPLLIAVLLGVPAVILLAESGPGTAASWPALLTTAVVCGLIVFEAASGGLLRSLVPGGAGLFALLVAFLTVFLWPMAAVLQVRYSWREAAIWMVAALIAVALSDYASFLWACLAGVAVFALALASALLARFVLILIVVAIGIGPAIFATFVSGGVSEYPSAVLPYLGAWPSAMSVWAGTPVHGTGAGTAVAKMLDLPGQSVFLQLLIGTGAVGFTLGMAAVCLIAHRAVRNDISVWRGASAAGLIGTCLAMSVSGPGLWQPWWIAAMGVAAIGIAGALPVAATGGSLGSIFDAARDADADSDAEPEDDGLYHFDDDDDYDDDYDDDEDGDAEWEIDGSKADNRPADTDEPPSDDKRG